jgi:hypothetical protein
VLQSLPQAQFHQQEQYGAPLQQPAQQYVTMTDHEHSQTVTHAALHLLRESMQSTARVSVAHALALSLLVPTTVAHILLSCTSLSVIADAGAAQQTGAESLATRPRRGVPIAVARTPADVSAAAAAATAAAVSPAAPTAHADGAEQHGQMRLHSSHATLLLHLLTLVYCASVCNLLSRRGSLRTAMTPRVRKRAATSSDPVSAAKGS